MQALLQEIRVSVDEIKVLSLDPFSSIGSAAEGGSPAAVDGAGRVAVYAVIVGESFCLTVIGGLFGLALLFLSQWALAPFALAEWSLRLPDTFVALRELPSIGVILLAGTLAGVIPAEKAFRNSLADGLTPRN